MIRRRAALVVLWLLLPVTCVDSADDGPSTDATPDSATPGPAVGAAEVAYELVWDTGGVTRQDSGTWSVTSDLGFLYTVTGGWVVTYAVQLVPCPRAAAAEPAGWPRLRRALLGSGAALAGHGDDNDPSIAGPPRLESLLDLEPLSLGPSPTEGATYCLTHYLSARGDASVQAVPAGTDVSDVSIWIRGAFQGPADAEPTPFEWSTDFNRGGFNDLKPPLDTSAAGATVRITRPAGTLFDGVDPTALDPKAAAEAVLKNLISGLQVSLL